MVALASFEENTFTASGTDHPKVGAIFKNTGLEDNFFYNNTFNGFADLDKHESQLGHGHQCRGGWYRIAHQVQRL